MKTSYEQLASIGDVTDFQNLKRIIALAKQENCKPSSQDNIKILFLGIDPQIDFMPGGSLAVPNANSDMSRACKLIYRNIDKISCITSSKDTHFKNQIFFPSWWIGPDNKHPDPYTIITLDDVLSNKWTPIYKKDESLIYLNELESRGKKKLCIWPYHTLYKTKGWQFVNEYAIIRYFHSFVRNSDNPIIIKGQNPCSEMYGIIRPEYSSKKNSVNTYVLDYFRKYDLIYIFGEAASHCVLESLLQIAEYFIDKPEILKKIYVIVDCMSSIPTFEEETKKAFEYLYSLGMNFVTAEEVVLP